MSRANRNPLILLEASTGIEPVYTDLQSAASPLRQLAKVISSIRISTIYTQGLLAIISK